MFRGLSRARPLSRLEHRASSTQPVTLRWSDGRSAGAFLPKFLRENTLEAWDSSSKQRLHFGIPLDLEVTDAIPVECTSPGFLNFKGPAFKVSFSDGHVGHFVAPKVHTAMWQKELHQTHQKRYWGHEEAAGITEDLTGGRLRFDWAELHDAGAKQRWIEAMHTDGVALVTGVPQHPMGVKDFAELLGTFVLPSVYGETFEIKAKNDPNNLAYSNLGLQMHTDLPFNAVPPSVQLFHCLEQAAEGGESIVMDGFAAAEALKAEDPEAFQLLCDHPLRFQDITPEWFSSAEHPTFEVSKTGSLWRVNFNERTRDSWRHWHPEDLHVSARVYEALQKFEKLVEERARYAALRLKPGEMVCTDNWRVMHSRSGFVGSRHFVGAYFDWDALHARWRHFAKTLEHQWDLR
ncbi:unnamed protein product [Durusdinium trenchii]|uniref:TauD/TfdA-like domain-containing protein n=1 Tax=Durusdinium trenchii TaxID=1381693 RepID=A0ABP0PAU1_9DINO